MPRCTRADVNHMTSARREQQWLRLRVRRWCSPIREPARGYSLLAFRWTRLECRFENAITCRFQCIQRMKNKITEMSDFDSEGNFMRFMRNVSKTGFYAILIKTAVHRTEYSVPCGRHRFSACNRFAISCWYRALISLTSIFTENLIIKKRVFNSRFRMESANRIFHVVIYICWQLISWFYPCIILYMDNMNMLIGKHCLITHFNLVHLKAELIAMRHL